MACGEFGPGRMAEPERIAQAAMDLIKPAADRPLAGRHVLVTSGPTHEPIDPVRYIANRSSGKQGHAIAAACAALGARVTLVSGPVTIPDPAGVDVVRVETAQEMLAAVEQALPADAAVFCAAVADWRVDRAGREKLKKDEKGPPGLSLVENPRHPRYHRAHDIGAARPRRRFAGRDRESDCARAGEAETQSGATGSWPTTCRRQAAASWAGTGTPSTS